MKNIEETTLVEVFRLPKVKQYAVERGLLGAHYYHINNSMYNARLVYLLCISIAKTSWLDR